MDTVRAKEIAASKILDIIGKKVTLRTTPHMKTAKGICPFHSEKTPSFVVWKATGRWKCFGCGAKGDATDFVMQMYDVNFAHALRIITGEINITRMDGAITTEQKQWLQVAMDAATNWAAVQQIQTQKNLCRDESTDASRERWKTLNKSQRLFLLRLDSLVEKLDVLRSRPPAYYFTENKTVSSLILRPNVQPFLYGSSEYRKNLISLVTNA